MTSGIAKVRNSRLARLSLTIAILLAAAGCVSQVEREEQESLDPADVEQAVESTTNFGFEMFHGLVELEPNENVVTSPLSASVFLMLLLNGSDGDTRQAIGDVLGLTDAFDESINDQFRSLIHDLEHADGDVELAIANSLWAQLEFPFEEAYLDTMQDNFDAQIEEVDLSTQEAADRIDRWVWEQTRELIEEIASDLNLPSPNSVLVLLNAVYFVGDWTEPFDPDRTIEGTFTRLDGSELTVPMMRKDDLFLNALTDDTELLRLPYGEDERFAMDVFLPPEEMDFEEFRDNLDSGVRNAAIHQLQESRLDVTLPRFELEYDTGSHLELVLADLGMGVVFGQGADFSAMSEASPWLDDVIQKTYIRVDEEGTEAAAVTGGDMAVSAPPAFRADRPFIFTITDTTSGAILFLGQVTDPSS